MDFHCIYIYIYSYNLAILTAIYAPTSTRLVIMPKSSNPLTFKIACIISSHLVALSLPSPGESFEPAEGAHQHPLSLPFSYNFKLREYRHLKCKPAFAVESEREALGGVGSVLSHESLRRIFYSVKVSELGLFHSSESHREEKLNSGGIPPYMSTTPQQKCSIVEPHQRTSHNVMGLK